MCRDSVGIDWKKFPFVRLLPVLAVGIVLGRALMLSQSEYFLIALSVFTAMGLLLWKSAASSTLPLKLSLAASGLILGIHQTPHDLPSDLDYTGRITVIKTPEEKPRSYKTIVELERFEGFNKPSKAILYFRKSPQASELLPGDQLHVNTRFSLIAKPGIKGQFDYSRFMARRGIYYSAFTDSTNWSFGEGIRKSMTLQRYASRMRIYLLHVIESYIHYDMKPLFLAMVLGIKSEMDTDTKTSFAKAGIMHILAVSGLHVSIVWLLFSALHKPLTKRKKHLRTFGILLEVIVIWAYAYITGLGPSVQRAAFMFSLFSISKLSGMKSSAVNITAASAFFLLIIRPSNLFEAGFQLSYAAVFGILLLYPVLSRLQYFRHPVANYIWSLETVSFAAVIATTPISAHYFNQVPLIFPITNLIAVPAAFMMVGGTVLLFMLHFIPMAGWFIGTCLSKIAAALCWSITNLASYKFSSVNPYYLDGVEVYLLYILLITITTVLYKAMQRKSALVFSLAVCMLFFNYRGTRKAIEYAEQEIYKINDGQTLLVNAGSCQFRIESTLPPPSSSNKYEVPLTGNHAYDMIKSIENIEIQEIEFMSLHQDLTGIID